VLLRVVAPKADFMVDVVIVLQLILIRHHAWKTSDSKMTFWTIPCLTSSAVKTHPQPVHGPNVRIVSLENLFFLHFGQQLRSETQLCCKRNYVWHARYATPPPPLCYQTYSHWHPSAQHLQSYRYATPPPPLCYQTYSH